MNKPSSPEDPAQRPTVAFEASSLLGELTGVGIYARELLPALRRWVQASLFLSSLKAELPPWISAPGGPGDGAKVVRSRWPARGLLLSWHHVGLPRMETLTGPCDLVHSINYTAVPTRKPLVVTLHDLWFLRRPGSGSNWGGRFFAQDLRRNLARVQHFIAVSETTRRDAVELLNVPANRITVVLEAPRSDFLQPLLPARAEAFRRGLDLPERGYLLSYGNDDPRKNRAGLEVAYTMLWSRLRDAPPLLIVGGRKPDVLPHVPILWRPYLPAEELHAALSGALALVFPSFYEGFGLPAIEAMALGVPVAASASGAIAQIAGPCFVELDPYDPEQMSDALARLCTNSELQARFRQTGPQKTAALSWDRAAAETFAVYQKLLKS